MLEYIWRPMAWPKSAIKSLYDYVHRGLEYSYRFMCVLPLCPILKISFVSGRHEALIQRLREHS
jgi:hypothetical protein